ncbi:hypothetical protein GCM10011494_36920 [Novosphingobium endophyticum]|uniref:Gluconate 2-dehydrogenase subunit 3 family protein n=1 Tax=Novosphingobium endophyticum TaxID=1955250 RepID=A0A916TVZ7_9SPHN|nr:gluconate 2-dehydrogenase subunit 3 family protein [Novosphingobium endophyticum]GGC14712.1 hypothetical protein GCM10011494_36920 [Novosphingobium endophyticum]
MTDIFMLDRRSLIARALALVGATVATGVPLSTLANTAERVPYLDSPRYQLLSAISDTIIPATDTPGALAAEVPARFEALLLHWASSKRRYQLVSAMNAIDALAHQAHGKGFADLAPQQRHEILASHDAEAMQIDPARQPTVAALRADPGYVDPAYVILKELIVVLYYVSEPALTQELSYEHSPGEWKPSIPVTPETRPAGGGLI